MPNYCFNYLKVFGDAETIKKFADVGITNEPSQYSKIKEDVPTWRLSNYFPIPEELEGTDHPTTTDTNTDEFVKKYGVANWYDWRVKNYGTKWDCSTTDFDTDVPTEFQVTFDSAWSPPIAWLEKVQKDFPTLKFKLIYEEPNNWFAGVAFTAETEEGEEVCIDTEEGEPIHYVDDIGDLNFNGFNDNSYTDENGAIFNYNEDEDVYVSSVDDEVRFSEDDVMTKNPFDFYVCWFE